VVSTRGCANGLCGTRGGLRPRIALTGDAGRGLGDDAVDGAALAPGPSGGSAAQPPAPATTGVTPWRLESLIFGAIALATLLWLLLAACTSVSVRVRKRMQAGRPSQGKAASETRPPALLSARSSVCEGGDEEVSAESAGRTGGESAAGRAHPGRAAGVEASASCVDECSSATATPRPSPAHKKALWPVREPGGVAESSNACLSPEVRPQLDALGLQNLATMSEASDQDELEIMLRASKQPVPVGRCPATAETTGGATGAPCEYSYWILAKFSARDGTTYGEMMEVPEKRALKVYRDNWKAMLQVCEIQDRVQALVALQDNTAAVETNTAQAAESTAAVRDLTEEVSSVGRAMEASALEASAAGLRRTAMDALAVGIVVYSGAFVASSGLWDALLGDPLGPWNACWRRASRELDWYDTMASSGSAIVQVPWVGAVDVSALQTAQRSIYAAWMAAICATSTAMGLAAFTLLASVLVLLCIKSLSWLSAFSGHMPGLALALLSLAGAVAVPSLTLAAEALFAPTAPRAFGSGCTGGQVVSRALWLGWATTSALCLVLAQPLSRWLAATARAAAKAKAPSPSSGVLFALSHLARDVGWGAWYWVLLALVWPLLTAWLPFQAWSHRSTQAVDRMLCWAKNSYF